MEARKTVVPFAKSTLLVGLFMGVGSVYASPTVTGSTISWPDDGWYQVQTSDGAVTLCSGGSSCDVSPGSYLVINHTTGERFSDITVSDVTTPAPSSVTVAGSTISWPDDGWYQVQTEDGLRSVCEGATACVVDPGRYVVINHTTGERFTGIEVVGDSGPDEPVAVAAVTVSGNVISWPDDGWYQVQTSDGSRSVCEGGRSCEVAAGSYKVINHTTGVIAYDVVVGGPSPESPEPVVDRVTVDGTTIFWPDNGWYQVQNAESFATVCEGGLRCDVSPGSYIVINHTDGSRQSVTVEGDTPPAEAATVQVNFNITVPAYASDALQVQVQLGDTLLTAAWLFDETWSVTGELPADTEQPLTISFFDDNGEVTLASIETRFRTSSDRVQDYQVNADQFNSERWDDDGDGASNLSELRDGRDPAVADSEEGGSPVLGDADFQITVENGESGVLSVTVGVPDPEAGELGGDFMILFDRSGSYGDDLATFRREVNDIELALADSFSNFRIGLGSFVDAPCRDFGSGSDFGYELNLPISPPGMLQETLNELDIRYGNDEPESQLEAMRQAMTGEGHIVNADLFPSCAPSANIMATSPNWAENRVKFLLVSTDASFHRPSETTYPYQTTVQDVIDLASESKTTILFLNSGSADLDSHQIATATGGSVSDLGSASQEVVSRLKSAVASTITSVEVGMKAVGAGSEFVTFIEPEQIDLNLLEDRTINFQVTLIPDLPSADEDRVYTFELVTETQGAEISRLVVELTVPADS